MKYSIIQSAENLPMDRFRDELLAELAAQGHSLSDHGDETRFIVNFTPFDKLEAVYRSGQHEFVVSIAILPGDTTDFRFAGYNGLVRTISNLFMGISLRDPAHPEVYCITPEVGLYHFPYSAEAIYKAMSPIIHAHFAIHNRIRYDLPESFRETEVTRAIRKFGKQLGALGALPAPFPLAEALSPENLEHLYKMFEIMGISYGNLSAREAFPEIGPMTFWMTGRGVDKANLQGVGRDILLVEGYDPKTYEIFVRVPADANRRLRVSVDAIEHVMIYSAFPEIKAIVHSHTWMDGVSCTRQNYPCGTIELAQEVVELLGKEPDPAHAVVGLKNHGLTITGSSFEDIFSRITGHLRMNVPMMA